MTSYILIYLLFTILFVIREVIHYKETQRKDNFIQDLELRLASKSNEEYVRMKQNLEPVEEMIDEKDDLIPLEDMSDDQIDSYLAKGDKK